MGSNDGRLLEEFRQFLGAGKVADESDPELRDEYSVPTGLEEPVASALERGRNVVVAGSAGSGKTHLIKALEESDIGELPDFVKWPEGEEPSDGEFIRVIRDVTAWAEEMGSDVFATEEDGCWATVIAANEGPLLDLAAGEDGEIFQAVVESLHRAQRGLREQKDSEIPVVVDMAGYDPIQNNVVARLLDLPLLHKLVEESDCCSTGGPCYRKLAWKQLQHSEVRDRVNALLRFAHMQGTSLLFRQLWNFVGDLVLRGDCDTRAPTSAWFWRVFHGKSEVSRRLRSVTDPGLAVFPRLEAKLYYGDWNKVEAYLLDAVAGRQKGGFLPPPCEPPFGDEKAAVYDWLKTQAFFVHREDSVLEVMRDQVDLAVSEFREQADAPEMIEWLNSYMTYDTLDASRINLELWSDLGVERRSERVRGQVSFGSVDVEDLEIRRSRSICNHPDPSVEVFGSRTYLVDIPSDSSLLISPEIVNLLRAGRSSRTADRPHTDLEWFLLELFTEVASSRKNQNVLRVLTLDFEKMEGTERSYLLSLNRSTVEPRDR